MAGSDLYCFPWRDPPPDSSATGLVAHRDSLRAAAIRMTAFVGPYTWSDGSPVGYPTSSQEVSA